MGVRRSSLSLLLLATAVVWLQGAEASGGRGKSSSEVMDSISTVLVTGGAGYVGSHTIVELLENAYSVVVVDNLANAYKGNGSLPVSLQRVQEITGKSITFYNVDVLDNKALGNVFEKHKIDVVLHFAALKNVRESWKIPLPYYRNNVVVSIVLLETMKKHGVRKLIFSSSSAAYGTPKFLPMTEAHPTGQGCTNPYGRTKYFVEEIIKDLVATDKDWTVIIFRYFNLVGAHESGRIGDAPQGVPNNLMPYIAQVAAGEQKYVKVYGNDSGTPDGTSVRDYIHISDIAAGHVKALWRLMKQAEPRLQIYNLGTGQGHSVLEVIRAFEEACGHKIPYEICPRRKGDIAILYGDPSLAKMELNWEAKKTLSDMWNQFGKERCLDVSRNHLHGDFKENAYTGTYSKNHLSRNIFYETAWRELFPRNCLYEDLIHYSKEPTSFSSSKKPTPWEPALKESNFGDLLQGTSSTRTFKEPSL